MGTPTITFTAVRPTRALPPVIAIAYVNRRWPTCIVDPLTPHIIPSHLATHKGPAGTRALFLGYMHREHSLFHWLLSQAKLPLSVSPPQFLWSVLRAVERQAAFLWLWLCWQQNPAKKDSRRAVYDDDLCHVPYGICHMPYPCDTSYHDLVFWLRLGWKTVINTTVCAA